MKACVPRVVAALLAVALEPPCARASVDMIDATRSYHSFDKDHNRQYARATEFLSRQEASTERLSANVNDLRAVESTYRHPGRGFAIHKEDKGDLSIHALPGQTYAIPDRVKVSGTTGGTLSAWQLQEPLPHEHLPYESFPYKQGQIRTQPSLSEFDKDHMGVFATERDEVEPWLRETTDAVPLSVGFRHLCGISRLDSSAFCLGENNEQQSTPPSHGQAVVQVAAGTEHSCLIRSADKGLECWGSNRQNRLASPAGRFLAVAVGVDHSCAVREGDLQPVCWGNGANGVTRPPPGAALAAIACGAHHTCGISAATGDLLCWGQNQVQQSMPPPGRFVQVSAGYRHSCALAEDGSIHCWGQNNEGQCEAPVGQFISVACGHSHSCAIDASDGSLVCWGSNEFGQADPPAGSFAQISAGGALTCAFMYGEKFPTTGRYPEYPMQGSSTLCFGDNFLGAHTGGSQELGDYAYEDWLFFLPEEAQRHFQ